MSPSFYVSLVSWVISLTVFGVSVTNLNEPPIALAASTIAWVLTSSLLGRWKQKQCGLRGLLCRWPSITEWELHISLLRAPVSKITYTVLSGTLNSTIPYHTIPQITSLTALLLPKWKQIWMKKRSETQTLRAGCSKVGHRPPAATNVTNPQTGLITIYCAAS